jgi:hypothetical protein
MVRLSKRNWIWSLIAISSILSCTNLEPDNTKSGSFNYVQKDITVNLPDTVNLENISKFKFSDDSSFYFYEKVNQKIYFLNYYSNYQHILDVDFLDSNVHNIELIYFNNDSLIMLSEETIDIYFKGNLINRKTINNSDNYSFTNIFDYFPPYYQPNSNSIYINSYNFSAYNKQEHNLCKYSIESSFNMKNKHVDTLKISYPKIYCEYDFGFLFFIDRTSNFEHKHYYSFSMSENVIEYDLNTSDINFIQIKSKHQNKSFSEFGVKFPKKIPENKLYNMFYETPEYTNIVFDKYRNYLYRFFIKESDFEGQEPKMGEREMYLLIYDLNKNVILDEIFFSRQTHYTDIIILKDEILISKNNSIYDNQNSKTNQLYFTSISFK